MRIKVVAYPPHNEVAALPEKDRKKGEPGNFIDVPDELGARWIKNNLAIPIKPPPPPKIEPIVVEQTPFSPLEEALLTHGGVHEVSEIVDEPEESITDSLGQSITGTSTDDEPEEEPEEETDDMAKSIKFAVRSAPERALSRRGRKRKFDK